MVCNLTQFIRTILFDYAIFHVSLNILYGSGSDAVAQTCIRKAKTDGWSVKIKHEHSYKNHVYYLFEAPTKPKKGSCISQWSCKCICECVSALASNEREEVAHLMIFLLASAKMHDGNLSFRICTMLSFRSSSHTLSTLFIGSRFLVSFPKRNYLCNETLYLYSTRANKEIESCFRFVLSLSWSFLTANVVLCVFWFSVLRESVCTHSVSSTVWQKM